MTVRVPTGPANQRRGEAERLAVVQLFRAAGFVVVNLSQPGLPRGVRGRRGTFQTPGLPDLRIYDPRGLVPPVWFEVKAGGAKPTAAQFWFARLAVASGEGWLHGGVERAKERLRAVGCLQQRGGQEVLVPLRGTAA